MVNCPHDCGGTPYIWQVIARPISQIVYGLLEVREGDRILIIGEGIEPAGWERDLKELVGPSGEVVSFEIIREGRETILGGKRGRGGVLGNWQWKYSHDFQDGHFDCVAALQSAQHCDDWEETGRELLRVMRPGRRFVSAEAMLNGPEFHQRIKADVHLQQWWEKMTWNMDPSEIPMYTGEDLKRHFGDAIDDPHAMEWHGIEMFWGRKPAA